MLRISTTIKCKIEFKYKNSVEFQTNGWATKIAT